MASHSLTNRAAVAFALLFALTLSVRSAPFQFSNGDLILGFQASSGTGSTKNVFLNLGPGVSLRDNGNPGQIANIGTTLATVFGANWYSRNDLYFGVIANLNASPPSGFGSKPPVDGDPSRTFYLSAPSASPGSGVLIPEDTYVSAALGSAGTKLSGMESMLVGSPELPGLDQGADGTGVLDQGLHPVQWYNGWTYWNPPSGAAFDIFTGGIQQTFGKGGSATYLDIQRVLATNTGAEPTGVVGGGVYVSTISISNTGVVSAITPAPSLPEIEVEQPAGTPLTDGSGTLDLGTNVAVGSDGSELSFTISNSGTANLTGLSITKVGSHPGDFTVTGPAVSTLAPSASTTFTVTFQPTAAGTRSAELRIASNDADENPFNIQVSGSAFVPAPEIVVEQPAGTDLVDGSAALAFGNSNIGASVIQTVTVRNTGTANLTGLSVSKSGSHAADFTIGTLGSTSLAAGASTTFTVTFAPSAAGIRTAALEIASNDADENPFDISLGGTGVAVPEIVVEQPAGTNLVDGVAALAFGNSNIGVPVVQTVTIRSTGTANLTGLSVSKSGSHAADFTIGTLGSTSLAAGASTTFTVTFAPSAAGIRTAALQIASNDADENPFDISLGGTGVAVPEIVVEQPAGTNLVDGVAALAFGNSNIGVSVVQTVTVRNTGTANLTGLAVTASGTHAADFALGALGATSLAPNASTTFTVTFTPSAAGSRTAALQIASNDADENPFDISLGGTGVAVPEIVVEQPAGTNLVDGVAALAFGNSNIGVPVVQTVTVRNTGTANLTGLAVTASGTHAADFALGALGATSLAPNASTTFTVTFTPSAAGSRTAALQIASNDADENPFDISLGGTGAAVPEIAVEQPAGTNLVDGVAALAFGNASIGNPVVQTVTVRNTGTANLTGLAVTASGTHASDFALGALGATSLIPNASTTFTVTFTPSAAGSRTAALQIASNDADENPFDISLGGTGVAASEIVVEQPEGTNLVDGAAALAFGNLDVGTPDMKTVTVRNTGTANLTGLAVTASGSHAADFALGALGATSLAPNASTTFTVTFTPSAVGVRSATIEIASNDADENPFDISLGGTGVAVPEIVVEQPAGTNLVDGAAALAFGNSNIGVPAVQTVTVRNTGTANLTGLAVSRSGTHAADFALGALGATSLAPNASTTFTVTFTPSAAGTRDAALQIVSNDADENPFDISLGGTGVAVPEIVVEQPAGTNLVDGAAALAFGNSNIGVPVVRTVTVRNTGTANLTGLAVTASGTHAADFSLGVLGATSLAPNASTTFTVTFTPSAAGVRSAAIEIASNDADENPFDITLGGTGVAVPEIVVEQPAGTDLVDGAAALAFGNSNIGVPVVQTVTVRNTGSANLTGLAVTRSGTNAADFVLGSLGATSLAPNASTTFTVTFTPPAVGTRTAVLQIASNDADENPFDIALNGAGALPEIEVEQPAGTPLVSGASTISLGTVASGQAGSPFSFVIKSAGTGTLTLSSISLIGTDPADFILTGPSSMIVASGDEATFTVQYSPSAIGSSSATIRIASDDDDENPFDIQITGTSVQFSPEIVVEQPVTNALADGISSIDLGANLVVGTSGADFSFTIRNTGNIDLTGIAITMAGSHPGDFTLTGPAVTTLAQSESTTFTVKFQPTAAGNRSAELQIASNDGDENPFNIALTGSAYVPAPEIDVEQPAGTPLVDGTAELAFGDSMIGTPVMQTVTVRNTGTADLTGLAVTSSGTNAADFALGALGSTTLAQGDSTTFTVTFTPSATGSRAAALEITSNDSDENPFNISLAGTGVAPEIVVEQPVGTDLADGTATLDSGDSNIGSPVVQTVTVRNTGTADLTGLAVTTSGTHAADFALGALGATSLAPNESTTFTVTFTPSAAGVRSAALEIASNDSDENPFDIALTGTGIEPEIVVEQPENNVLADGAATLAFGDSNIGVPVVLTVTVRNTGTADLTGLAVTRSGTNAPDFILGVLGSTSLAPSESTTFSVTFTPSATGSRGAALQILSNDGDENPFNIALAGTGVLPEIEVEQPAGTPLFDGAATLVFGDSNLGTPVIQTVTVRNTGTADLTGLAVTASGTNAADFILGALGTTTLAPSASTTFTVTFTPSAAGSRSAALEIASNDADENPFDIVLSGTGLEAEIVVEQPAGTDLVDGAAALAFGNSNIGVPVVQTVTVRNIGTANLTGLAVTASGTHAADFDLGALGATSLAPNASTTFTVTFTPSAAGTRSAALAIASNDADENPFDISLGGTGVAVPEIVVEQPAGTDLVDGAAALAFGNSNIGVPVVQTVTVRNTGTADLTGIEASVSGTDAADFAAGSPGSTALAPGAETTFTVTFTPSAQGTRSAGLTIASNDADENPFDISLGGTGVAVPEIVVEQPAGTDLVDGAAALAFGNSNIGVPVVQTVTVRNTGTADLTGIEASVSGTDAADFAAGSPGSTALAPGAETTFTVTFTPSAQGTRSAALQIASNDSDENPFDIALTGTGVVPAVPEIVVEQPVGTDLADGAAALAFGNSNIGVPVVQTVTVRNTGTADLTGIEASVSGTDAADFAAGSPGSTILAPGAETTFTVTFTPSAAGTRSAALQIASNDADENPFDIALTGTGVVPAVPEIVVEQPVGTDLADGAAALAFGNSNIGVPVVQTVTVRNTGTADLTGIEASVSGTDAADFAAGSPGSTILAPGAETTFTVTFTPSAAGTRSAALQIASNDADENPFDIALTGTGVVPAAPEIVVEQPVGTDLADGVAALDFGALEIGSPISVTVTVRNTGTADLTGIEASVSGTDAADFAAGSPGSTTLAPGAETTFTVTFTPSAQGTRSAALQIASNDADENPFDTALTGTGVVPAVPEIVVEQPVGTDLADGVAALDLGALEIGSPVTLTVTVRNTGTADLTGIEASVSGTDAADFAAGSPGSTTLAPGAETTFTVTFTPSAQGTRSAALQIASNDADENPFDIALTGTGVVPAAPEIVVEQPVGTPLVDEIATIDLGSGVAVGSSGSVVTFVIRNAGTAELTGIGFSLVGPHPGDFKVVGPGATSLAPSGTTTFTVRFQPLAAGNRSAYLGITSNDDDESTFGIHLSGGAVTSEPEIEITGSDGRRIQSGKNESNFGKVLVGRASLFHEFTVRNVGSVRLTDLVLVIEGNALYDFVTSGLNTASLDPGESTVFMVRFKPTEIGARKAVVRLASNDPDENPFELVFSGNGLRVSPEIAVKSQSGFDVQHGSTTNFGVAVVDVGMPKVRRFTIKNTGTGTLKDLRVKVGGMHPKDIKVMRPSVKSLAPGKSTRIKVVFSPKADGRRSAKILIKSNDPDESRFKLLLRGYGVSY